MLEITDKEVNEFKQFLDEHEFFFVAGHKEPDGDAIASCLGIKSILEYFHKDFELLSAGPFKRNEIKQYEKFFTSRMRFMDETDRKKTGLIIVDCSELKRLGDIDGDLKGFDTYIIDHHKTGELIENSKGYINPAAPACAFLIQLYYEKLIGALPSQLAEIIFFGLSTDTGFFRFCGTNSAPVFSAAGRLVDYGVDPRKIYNYINSGKPYSTRKLLGVLLDKAERFLDGRLVITYETLEDTKMYGAEGRDSDALYSLLLSAENVQAVVFLRQDTVSTCTGGFRSQDKIDVSSIAAKFGGGGHKNASGMSCDGTVENLIPKIVKEFSKIM